MEQFEQFDARKFAVIGLFDRLRALVDQLRGVGIDVTGDLRKIDAAIEDVRDDVLRIVLVGAFSDGKTSVAAGWLGAVLPDMKIDTDESSDRRAFYQPKNLPGKCEIVDTPGLFGDRKGVDERDGAIVRLGDITTRYVSEAHLVLYVVDATNPLKDSHKGAAQLILRDLDKLSATIFVINKMDEVADLRDAEEFEEQARIKKDNLLLKLQRFVGLTEAERAEVKIACISANPQGRGIEHWLSQRDDYEARSRIGALKSLTLEVLGQTVPAVMIRKTGLDVIKQVLGDKLRDARQELEQVVQFAKQHAIENKRIQDDIDSGTSKVLEAKEDLRGELMALENRLTAKIRTLSRADIAQFLDEEIGHSGDKVGYVLRSRIDQACERCFRQSAQVLTGVGVSIQRQVDISDEFYQGMAHTAFAKSRSALDAISKMPVDSIKKGVIAARDVLSKLTGLGLKFKPWGAENLAQGIGRMAGPASAGVQLLGDIVSMVQQRSAENELKKLTTSLMEFVKAHFVVVYEIFDDRKQALATFAPQIAAFEKILADRQSELAECAETMKKIDSIEKALSKISGEAAAASVA